MTIHFEKLGSDLASASAPFGSITVPRRHGIYRNFVKRAVDTALIIIAAPVFVPVVALLALFVARDGHAPIYSSLRVGKNGKLFRMYKLRTMVPNAELLLAGYLASDSDARAEWQSTQKLKDDPRITLFGRFLRKYSFDELPQIWNVLTGEMSLVGPRPMQHEQRSLYPGLAYYALRPGITGPWQVSERNDSEFAKRAEHDGEYDRQMSFIVDAKLLASTVVVIFKGTGF